MSPQGVNRLPTGYMSNAVSGGNAIARSVASDKAAKSSARRMSCDSGRADLREAIRNGTADDELLGEIADRYSMEVIRPVPEGYL
jgi:hypothetical protein